MKEYSDTSHILYYLYCILRDYTDEEEGHYLSQLQIQRILRDKYDIDPDRKTIKKQLVMTKNKKSGYTADPFAMVYNDGFYYMMSYSAETEEHIKTYRVDKIQKVEILDDEIEEQPLPKDYLKNLKKRSFGMFTGHDRTVTLSCDKSKAGIIIDRFGKDVPIFLTPDSLEKINATVTVTVSRQFYGWLFGAGIKVAEPEDVKDDYVKYLRETLEENEK